jgi:D-sedoheptulose 7-phosphate isomerase
MKEKFFFNTYINNFSKLLQEQLNFTGELNHIRKILLKIKKNKKKIMIFGNGGSASIANHFATDLTKIAGIRSVVCNESNLITCFANDYGFENWIKKSIEFYGDKGDCLIVISSSGQSKNIINACIQAKENRFSSIITLTGFNKNNSVKKFGNINLWVNSNSYNYIENIHQILLLSIVDSLKLY